MVAGLLALLLVAELIWYVERTQRELASFLSSIAHQDFSVPIPELHKGRVFDKLEDAYRVLSAQFTRLNLQKAANHQYLEAVVEHVGVALVSLDDAGKVAHDERARAAPVRPAASAQREVLRRIRRRACRHCSSGSATVTATCCACSAATTSLQLVLYCTDVHAAGAVTTSWCRSRTSATNWSGARSSPGRS